MQSEWLADTELADRSQERGIECNPDRSIILGMRSLLTELESDEISAHVSSAASE